MEMVNVDWISVKDQLPEDDMEVLALGCGPYGNKQMGFTKFNASRGWELHRCSLDKVCYWVYYQANLPDCECEDYSCEPNRPLQEEKKGFFARLFS